MTKNEKIVVSVPSEYRGSNFLSYEWNFGDGSDHVFLEPGDSELDGLSHTYVREGQFTITLTVEGEDSACGGAFEAAGDEDIVEVRCRRGV